MRIIALLSGVQSNGASEFSVRGKRLGRKSGVPPAATPPRYDVPWPFHSRKANRLPSAVTPALAIKKTDQLVRRFGFSMTSPVRRSSRIIQKLQVVVPIAPG